MTGPRASWQTACDLGHALARVDAGIRKVVRSDAVVAAVCAGHLRRRGKRLRPALLLAAARLGTAPSPEAIRSAVAVELLHTGTLCHDDVVDEAARRRFGASVNARWGNAVAVLTGGYLVSRAMQLFARSGDEVNRLVTCAVHRLARGQSLELEHTGDLELDEAGYFAIIGDKTAALYELAVTVGATLGGLSARAVDAIARYGAELGTAFQMIDDVLDLVGDERALGKPRGTDLRGGIYTLPVIRALGRSDTDARRLRELLAGPSSDERVAEALTIVAGSGSIDTVARDAHVVLGRAVDHLASVPPGPARDALSDVPEQLVVRLRACEMPTATTVPSFGTPR